MQLFKVLSMIQDKMKTQKLNALHMIREQARMASSQQSGSSQDKHVSGFSN
jgi:hypothetical protein